MSKKTIFQPDHLGRRAPDSNPGKSLARSHNMAADIAARHGDKPNIARDASRAAHTYDLKIHGGMVKQTKSGPLALGGDHATAIDSLSGREVVPGTITSQAGWGNGGVVAGHPLTAPPKSKNFAPAPPVIGHRSRVGDTFNDAAPGENAAKRKPDSEMLHSLGRAVLAEATCDSQDRQALTHLGIGSLSPVVKEQ